MQSFLSKLIKLRETNDSGPLDLDTHKSFSLIGYGSFRAASQLAIETNLGTFTMISKMYPHYANWTHALDELLVEDSKYFSKNIVVRSIRRIIRAVSIGASRGSHFAGFLNGFICTAMVPHKSSHIRMVCHQNFVLHISRTASRTGLILADFSKEMERTFRRGPENGHLYITSAKNSNAYQSSDYPSIPFTNLKLGIRTSRIRLGYEFTQTPTGETIQKVNSYQRLSDVAITPQGFTYQFNLDGSVNHLDSATTHYWPSAFWKSKGNSKFLSPTVVGEIEVTEKASFMSWSSNWAHFVEDNLPSVLGLIQEDPFRKILTLGVLSSVQKETLKSLFPDSSFEPMLEGYVYKFKDVLINIHNDSRNLYIAGGDSDIDMIDESRLREIRRRSLSTVEIQSKNDLKLFISRRSGFRRLVNREKVEEIFRDHGFIIVAAEHLGFVDRISLFQRARIVAGESGAGLANLYFCKDRTKVIEITHPSVSHSREHLPLVSITAHEYQKLHGKVIGVLKKIRYGSDAFIADEGEVRNVLQNLYQ